LPPEFDGYRIALYSDIHAPRDISKENAQRAVQMAIGFRPDLIVITGDFVAQPKGTHWVPKLQDYFLGLEAPDGVYGVLGNHDHWTDAVEVERRILKDTSIQLLHAKHITLKRGSSKLIVGGVNDLWCGNTDVDQALEGADRAIPRILLSHNPDLAEVSTAKARVDLMLSGHTHGGQIRVPFGPAIHTPSNFGDKFAQGLVQGKRYRVFVTRGICSSFHARFMCRPEVVGITLRRMNPNEADSWAE
jgi:predicted MPP superfamily phosphohydrolase